MKTVAVLLLWCSLIMKFISAGPPPALVQARTNDLDITSAVVMVAAQHHAGRLTTGMQARFLEAYSNNPELVAYVLSDFNYWMPYVERHWVDDATLGDSIIKALTTDIVPVLGMRPTSYQYLQSYPQDDTLIRDLVKHLRTETQRDTRALNRATLRAIEEHYATVPPEDRINLLQYIMILEEDFLNPEFFETLTWEESLEAVSEMDDYYHEWSPQFQLFWDTVFGEAKVIEEDLHPAAAALPTFQLMDMIEHIQLPENKNAKVLFQDIYRMAMGEADAFRRGEVMKVRIFTMIDVWSPQEMMNPFAFRSIIAKDELQDLAPEIYTVSIDTFIRAYITQKTLYENGSGPLFYAFQDYKRKVRGRANSTPRSPDYFLAASETRSEFLQIYLMKKQVPTLLVQDDVIIYDRLRMLVNDAQYEANIDKNRPKVLDFKDKSQWRTFYDPLEEPQELLEPDDVEVDTKAENHGSGVKTVKPFRAPYIDPEYMEEKKIFGPEPFPWAIVGVSATGAAILVSLTAYLIIRLSWHNRSHLEADHAVDIVK